jgi:signal transduction histidine kinase
MSMQTIAGSRSQVSLIAEVVRDDHAELERMIARLRALSDVPVQERTPADPEPAALIEQFEDLLLIHFAAEEAEEFFGSLVTDQPWLLDRIGRLQREHGQLATALDDLLEFARSEPRVTELTAHVERFLGRLDAHERAENALMQDLILLDEGGDA